MQVIQKKKIKMEKKMTKKEKIKKRIAKKKNRRRIEWSF
jgi:hypothetical protein